MPLWKYTRHFQPLVMPSVIWRDWRNVSRWPDALGKRVFRVVVKPFMDAHTYDQNRVEQCCTKIVNERGEAVSFCEFNVFHRGLKNREAVVPLTMVK